MAICRKPFGCNDCKIGFKIPKCFTLVNDHLGVNIAISNSNLADSLKNISLLSTKGKIHFISIIVRNKYHLIDVSRNTRLFPPVGNRLKAALFKIWVSKLWILKSCQNSNPKSLKVRPLCVLIARKVSQLQYVSWQLG